MGSTHQEHAPSPSGVANIARVRGQGSLARYIRWLLWFVLFVSYTFVAWGRFYPHTFAEHGTIAVGLAWSSFIARTFTFHLGLVLVGVVGLALVLRARWLCILTTALALYCVAGLVWSLLPKHPEPIAGASLKIATCNVLADNTHYDAYLSELQTKNLDIVVFQEVTREWRTHIDAAFQITHPHVAAIKRSGYKSILIRSNVRVTNITSLVEEHGFSGVLRVEIEIEGSPVALYGVHLLAPLSRAYLRRGRQQFADLADAIKAEQLPMIVLGDFNAPTESAQLDRLKKLGLRDAWDSVRRGRGGTWPNNAGVFSLLPTRIDHVMLSREFACADVRYGNGLGSDHKPVYVRIGFSAKP